MNPDPVFVVCPPRSGTTVFRAMLGLHPGLCSFPELNPFQAATVGDLLRLDGAAVPGEPPAGYSTGLVRAWAWVMSGSHSARALRAAGRWLEEHAALRCDALFADLQAAVAPRLLVEGSTRTALQPAMLQRAANYSPQTRLIHLSRRPRASVLSMSRWVTAQVPKDFVHPYCAELWCAGHENILALAPGLGRQRYFHLSFEELCRQPRVALSRVLEWLGLECSGSILDRMLRPDRWPFAHPAKTGMAGEGAPDFFSSPAWRGQEVRRLVGRSRLHGLHDDLGRRVSLLSERLGYAGGRKGGAQRQEQARDQAKARETFGATVISCNPRILPGIKPG